MNRKPRAKMKPTLTVVTPTYNRAGRLRVLFESLRKQTVFDFVWMIVDDGSTDGTVEELEAFKEVDPPFPLVVRTKANGGKHTALNAAIWEVETELLFIVDSDDFLTEDAIETILRDWAGVSDRRLCGICYLRGYTPQTNIGDLFPQDGMISNFIDVRYNEGVNGDKAEVWVTRYLCEVGGFPEYEGERFVSESVLWIKVSRRYDMLFRNKIVYITEYLEGGLSDAGRPLRFRCPHLMAYGSLETMTSEFSLRMRIKQALLYVVYSAFGQRTFGQMLRMETHLRGYRGAAYPYPVFTRSEKSANGVLVALCYLPGMLLYHYWKKKYNK